MSEEKKEQERQERKERERIRKARLNVYNHFRNATYAMLQEAGNGKSVIDEYGIEVHDSQWSNANIIETIQIPQTQDREDYDLTRVALTPEQIEGYMFLTELGDIGGDPIACTVLSST